MVTLAGIGNLALGVVYITIGTMVALDLERAIRQRGWSHFGVAWLTIMYTCGAHHLVHGIHVAGEGRSIGIADMIAVAAGLPAGLIWSWLRVEAVRGGRGDRFVPSTPAWLRALALGYAALLAGSLVWAILAIGAGASIDTRLLPNLLLVVLYLAIGGALLRGQLGNLGQLGGWSLSGLSLMMIFPTCAIMHGVYVVYAATGSFAVDFHGLWVDWLSVPAALYFLWVLRALEAGTLRDWNKRFEAIDDLGMGASRSPEPVMEVLG